MEITNLNLFLFPKPRPSVVLSLMCGVTIYCTIFYVLVRNPVLSLALFAFQMFYSLPVTTSLQKISFMTAEAQGWIFVFTKKVPKLWLDTWPKAKILSLALVWEIWYRTEKLPRQLEISTLAWSNIFEHCKWQNIHPWSHFFHDYMSAQLNGDGLHYDTLTSRGTTVRTDHHIIFQA